MSTSKFKSTCLDLQLLCMLGTYTDHVVVRVGQDTAYSLDLLWRVVWLYTTLQLSAADIINIHIYINHMEVH